MRHSPDAADDAAWPVVELGGVTELRVHGVGGTTPPEMLDVLDPVQVSGDRTAGVWRGPDRVSPDGTTRHVEAYSWGGLTGRAATRALWLLVLPFALVNVAGWMAPGRDRNGFRGLVRLVGLSVTGLYVSFAAAAAMDFATYQCGGAVDRGRTCTVSSWWLVGNGGPAHAPARRVVIGALLPLLLLAVLWWLTRASRRAYEQWGRTGADVDPSAPVDGPASQGLTYPAFWRGEGYAARLAAVHLTLGLAIVAALVSRSANQLTTSPVAAWLTAVALVTVVAAFVLSGMTRWRRRLRPRVALAWGCGLVVASVAVAWFGGERPVSDLPRLLPGLPEIFDLLVGIQVPAVVAVLVAGLRTSPGVPHRLRHAYTPATVLMLASVTTLTVLSGFVLWLARRLGEAGSFRRNSARPPTIEYAQAFEVLARALPWAVLVMVGAALLAWVFTARRGTATAEHRARTEWDQVAAPAGWRDSRGDRSWVRAWRRGLRLPTASLAALEWGLWVLAGAAVPGAVFYGVLWVGEMNRQHWAAQHIQVDVPGLGLLPLSVCTWLLTGIPVVAVLVLRRALVSPSTRRLVAIAWDVATFWPRSFHPLAPPSYAERAVPELLTRLERLWGGSRGTPGQVLLLGHSQGSVLVTAAVAAMSDEQLTDAGGRRLAERLSVITYGCPVRRLYGRHFPAYFSDDVVEAAVQRLRLAGGDLAWHNAYRDTDYVGFMLAGEPGSAIADVDVYLADPPHPYHPPGDPGPRVRSHPDRGYRRQLGFVALVDAEVSRLSPPAALR